MSASRIGRKPVVVPAGVEVKIQDQNISVKGPKGLLTAVIHPFVHVSLESGQITVRHNTECEKDITGETGKLYKSITGTTRANIQNIITGVTQGYERKLQLVGVGYRAQAKGKELALSLGFSHDTNYKVPEGITVETPSQTEIVVKGVNKQLVGQVAAEIHDNYRSPEPYKGKGIRYADEVIEIKETKKK